VNVQQRITTKAAGDLHDLTSTTAAQLLQPATTRQLELAMQNQQLPITRCS
jgi:hypothetical protein